MALIEELYLVLKEIGINWESTKEIRQKISEKVHIESDLSNLERLGLIKREVEKPLSLCRWKITPEGKSFLRIYEKHLKEIEKEGKKYEIVMTLPPPFSKELIKKYPTIKLTDKIFKKMFSKAKNQVRILSPYVDASIITFLGKISPEIPIKVVTIPTSYGKNTVLERMKLSKNLTVKYLRELREGTQIFQIHAKIIIIDEENIYIGSANFRDTSIYYNLESGVLISEKDIILEYTKIFDEIYKNLAK